MKRSLCPSAWSRGRSRAPASLGRILPLLVLALLAPGPRAFAAEVTGITEPFLDVTLSSSVSGIVSARKFNEGDFVKEGDVLLELDKQLEELEVARRKLVADTRKSDLDATTTLAQNSKAVSREELEKKEVEHKVAVVEHGLASEQLRRRLLASPLAGTIAEIHLEVGEACQPYQPLLRVVDTRRCFFVANIDAAGAAGLRLNQTVPVQVDSGAAPVTVQARLVFISPVVDPASGLLKIKALFENRDHQVRPGVAGKMALPTAAGGAR